MASDVVINIFGEIGDLDVLTNLALLGSMEGEIEWSVRTTMEEVAEYIIEMAESGEPIVLVKNDVDRMGNMFPHVRDFAQKSGLPYAIWFGNAGDEGYDVGISWRPGLVGEEYFDLGGDSAPTVALSHLKDAFAAGPEAVAALIASTEAKAAIGPISIDPAVVDAYRDAHAPAL